MAVILARVLGVTGFGIYAFCLSIIQILTVPAMLGGQSLLIREVATYRAREEHHLLLGLLLRFTQLSLLSSFFLALCAFWFGYYFYKESKILSAFLLALPLIPLTTAIRLQAASIRGLGHVLLGQLSMTIRPLLVLSIVGGMFYLTDWTINPHYAIASQISSCSIILVFTSIFLYKILPKSVKQGRPQYETSKWIKYIPPFVFASGMQVLDKEIATFLLGVLQGPDDVSLFRVAQRGALLIPFGLQAVNMTIAPTVSTLATAGKMQLLQRLVNKSILGSLAFALPMSLILIFGGPWIIPLVFGANFQDAYHPLVILSLGQLFNAATGSVGLILNMVGQESVTAKSVAVATLIGLILNLVLIPTFGMLGAAIATSSSLIIMNILLFIGLYKITGIMSIPKNNL